MKSTKKVGLALGGGAARGLAHVGVIQALVEYEIPIHYIAGTSAGSVVGGLYASGVEIHQLVDFAKGLRWSDFARFQFSRMGMFSSKPLEQLIRSFIGNMTFSQLKIPFSALATDILTGNGKVLNDPNLEVALAIKASSSFPGVFEPTQIDGHYYCDGGASGNVPSFVVREMGAEVVIAVDVIPYLQLETVPKNLAAMVDRGLDMLLHHVSALAYKDVDIMLQPVTEYYNSFHVRRGTRMIELGRIAVEQNIDRIRKVVE